MGKPKGDFGLAIMLGGGSKKKKPSFGDDEDHEDMPDSEEEETSEEDSSLEKKAALYDEMKSCDEEGDSEGAVKALSSIIKLCMSKY